MPPETALYLEGIAEGANPALICAPNVLATACVEATALAQPGDVRTRGAQDQPAPP